MASTATTSPYRLRPTVLALSSVALAYGLYRVYQRYSTTSRSSLHRSNAIRRTGSQRTRRRGIDDHDAAGLRKLERREAETALASLTEKEHANSTYGDITYVELMSRLEIVPALQAPTYCVLIPSQLPHVSELVQNGFAEPVASAVRKLAEAQFILTFLSTEMPDGVTIPTEEATYLSTELARFDITGDITLASIERFNETAPRRLTDRIPLRLLSPPPLDGADDGGNPHQGTGSVAESQSEYGWREGLGNTSPASSGQDMLTLLYHIAEDNAKKEHIVHRGVQCNGCSMMPLRGVRYRCANCADYDLCETCEAMQMHIKTHVFYKIRIPTPWNTGPKQSAPVWYPGKPHLMPLNPSTDLMRQLVEQTGFEHSQLETFWEQFRVIAATEWTEDPDKVGVAIDRKTFDRAFLPGTAMRPPPPNLIFDRLFAFYDVNSDGLIGFREFVQVQVWLEGKTRDAKLRRIFFGYDLNNDGFVDRKDFLRMFRAWYALKREYMRDVLMDMQDDTMQSDLRETLLGSQPISSAFIGPIHPGHDAREGEGKRLHNGDLIVVDDEGIIREDVQEEFNRTTLVHDLERDRLRRLRNSQTQDLLGRLRTLSDIKDDNTLLIADNELPWPPQAPFELTDDDFKAALGNVVPADEVMDSLDRQRLYRAMLNRWEKETDTKAKDAGHHATLNRWHKREFYTDVEEGVTKPLASSSEQNSSDESDEDFPTQNDSASGSRPISPRSRSSSKVRFEDSITDTDYETRSNTSQRSIPVGERWGGYEIVEAEKDVGKEVLYLAVSEGFNELLDELFLEKEDAAMSARKTRKLRETYAKELQRYVKRPDQRESSTKPHHEGENSEQGLNHSTPSPDDTAQLSEDERDLNPALASLLEQSGYTIDPSLPSHRTEMGEVHDGIPLLPALDRNTVDPFIEKRSDVVSPFLDPTLPQNRPNSPSLEISLPVPSSETKTSAYHQLPNEQSSEPSPLEQLATRSSKIGSEIDIQSLLEDEKVDLEAKARGGHGRINFNEFVQKMVPDGFVGDNEGDKIPLGGLRKLGFVGAWIDMAGFF
ncbi:MAG: hypothetical protein Q9160_005246 [Pyrenula sp. 1 TL-2023]